jgi:hypothetical protein
LAHELAEQRRIILSIASDTIEMLVSYELPGGREAERLRQGMDMDMDGTITPGIEQLAQAQILLPRLNAGLSVSIDGVPLEMELADLEFRDGAGQGSDRGFLGMAIYRASREAEVGAVTTVAVSIAPDVAPAQAELQVVDGGVIVESVVPAAADAAVIGPVELLPDVGLSASVRWE